MRTRSKIVAILLLALALIGTATFACTERFQARSQHYQKVAAAEKEKAQKLNQETAKLQAEALRQKKAAAEQKLKEEQKRKAEEAERWRKYEQEVAERRANVKKAEAERMKPVGEMLKELPVIRGNKTLIIEPASPEKPLDQATIDKETEKGMILWDVRPPAPPITSEPFTLQPFEGPITDEITQIALCPNGDLVLATKKGGHVMKEDGKVQSVGKDKECTAIAISPTGEIALAFKLQKERRITRYMRGFEPSSTDDTRTVLEIHIINGPRPRVILLQQYWRQSNEGISLMAYNANGTMLAVVACRCGLTLITDDKVWQCPAEPSREYYFGRTLLFHPKDPNQLVCYDHRLVVDGTGKCMRSWVGKVPVFGSEGNLVCVRKDHDDLFQQIHDGDLSARKGGYRVDRIGVNTEFIVFTELDRINIWDRQSQKVVRYLRNVPNSDWTWMNGYVQSLAFSGKHLYVASSNGEVSKWNPATGEKLKILIPACRMRQ